MVHGHRGTSRARSSNNKGKGGKERGATSNNNNAVRSAASSSQPSVLTTWIRSIFHPFYVNHSTSLMPKHVRSSSDSPASGKREAVANVENAGDSDNDNNSNNSQLESGRWLFWGDKLLLLVDFFQILGLYWATANPWPLPYPWVAWTRWWTLFNVDVFSMLESGALAGKSGNTFISKWGSYDDYLLVFLLPFVLGTASVVGAYWYFHEYVLPTHGQRWDLQHSFILKALLHFLNFMYLPTGIAAFRGLYCYENVNEADKLFFGNYVMAADESQICYTGVHLLCLLLVLFLYVPIFMYLPYYVYERIASTLVYTLPVDHEKRLQSWELTHMLQIDTEFVDNQMWLFASHTRPNAFYRVWMLCYKALLLILYAFVRGNGNGDDNSFKVHQALLLWAATLVFLARYLLFNEGKLPYRVTSSNLIFIIFSAIMLGNTTLGVCNALGVNNVVTVNSRQTILLLSINFGGYLCMILILLVLVCNPYALWPSVRTVHRIELNVSYFPSVCRWVNTIHKAIKVRTQVVLSPDEVADALGLEKSIRDLRSCWLDARHSGSIFELILTDIIEELLIVRALRLPALARRNVEWDRTYKESLRNHVFAKRNDHYRLMAPRKRRVLTKLLSLRIMQQREPEVDADLWEAMSDERLKTVLRQVQLLERGTRQLIEKGESFEASREKKTFAIAVRSAGADAGQNINLQQAAKDGNFVANSAELEHIRDIEDALYRWENIIDTVEEAQTEQPFTRRLFTMNKMENWYLYRKMLLTQIAEFKHFFNLHDDDDDNNDDDGYGYYGAVNDIYTDAPAVAAGSGSFDKDQAAREGLL